MSPRPRLCDLFTNKVNVVGEDANKKAGTRIVSEAIESRIIDAGGAAYVIRGKLIKSSGQTIFQVGEFVNVLFKEDEPIVILGHTWRKAQFEDEPILPVVSRLEIAFVGTFGGIEHFWIVSPDGTISGLDDELFGEDGHVPQGISWGQNDNVLLLQFRTNAFPFGAFKVVRIKRKKGSTTHPQKIVFIGGEDKLLTIGGAPAMDFETVLEPVDIIPPDVDLGFDYTVRENLLAKTRLDLILIVSRPPPSISTFEVVVGETKDFPFDISQAHDMTLDGIQVGEQFPRLPTAKKVGDAVLGAYDTSWLNAYVDKSDQLIQTYRINWHINGLWFGNIASADSPQADPTLFRDFPVFGGIIPSVGCFGDPLIADGTFNFGDQDDVDEFFPEARFQIKGGIRILPVGFFPTHNCIQAAFGDFTLDAINEFQAGKIRMAPQRVPIFDAPGGASRGEFFDLVTLNRSVNNQIKASTITGDVTWEWDNFVDVVTRASFERSHGLDTNVPGSHKDGVFTSHFGFSDAALLSEFDTGFVNMPAQYAVAKVGDLPPIDRTRRTYQRIKNFRWSGRTDWNGIKPASPGEQEIEFSQPVQFFAFIQLELSPRQGGDQPPVTPTILRPGFSVDVDETTLIATQEPDPLGGIPSGQFLPGVALRPLVRNGDTLVLAIRTTEFAEDPFVGPNRKILRVLTWNLTSNTFAVLPFSERKGVTDDIEILFLQANDRSVVFVTKDEDPLANPALIKEILTNPTLVRPWGFGPGVGQTEDDPPQETGEFDETRLQLMIPVRFTDKDGSPAEANRIYKAVFNTKTNKVDISKTQLPVTDLLSNELIDADEKSYHIPGPVPKVGA